MILSPPERIAEYTGRGWWGTRRIQDWFDDAVESRAEDEALVDPPNRAEFIDGPPRRLTWRQLDDEVMRFAALLLELGARSGDIVCVQRMLRGLLFVVSPMDSPIFLNALFDTRSRVSDTGIALSVLARP